MHISDYGYTDPNDYSPCLPARVVGEHRGRYQIVCDAGAGFATLRGGAYYYGGETFPTVGDFVLLAWQQAGDSAIVRTLPRRSCFARRDPTPGRVAQAVAANFDTVLIAQSLNQDFNLPRLERTLALALQSGGAPVILLTKADLCADAQPYLAAVQQRFPDVPALAVSAATGAGMAGLVPYLAPGRTLVILGSSGVGKSSLMNALCGPSVAEADMLFATLDPTSRKLVLPSGMAVLLVDTVGFVSHLPHNLVEAFKSTLEEAAWSDVIVRVADAGDDQREEQLAITDEVLDGLDCADIPRLTVYNKCDKPGALSFDPDILLTSAKTGYGLEALLKKLDETLSDRVHTIRVLLPYDKLGLAAPMRERGSVQVEEYREDGLYLEGIVKTEDLHCFEGYLV